MNTETLSERKINLIVRISKLDKEDSVHKIEKAVDSVERRPTAKQLEMLEKLAKPMRKKLDLDELKARTKLEAFNKRRNPRNCQRF